MTKQEAQYIFDCTIRPHIDKKDKVALRTAWNDWTDRLQKDGEITPEQYDRWINPYDK